MTSTGASCCDALGTVALLLQLGEGERLLDPGLPAGEGVGEEDAGALGLVVRQGRVEGLHSETDLQVGDDEGRGHDLEAEDPLGGGALHRGAGESAEAAALQVGGDAAQRLGKVGARAAAGIEDVDVVRREPVGDAEIVLEGSVDAGDHVAHHLGGGVPDAKLLAEIGVEGFEEGLVEVGHRLALVEPREEGGPVHAVEGRRGPVQHLDEAEGAQASGAGKLLEERPQHRGAQMPDRGAPVEHAGGRRRLARPEDPGGENAVEERLHQCRAEEGRAAFVLEADAQRLLQGGADGGERRRVAGGLDPRQTVAGVGGEQPGQVPRLDERGAVGERTGEVLTERGAFLLSESARMLQPAFKLIRAHR